MGNLGFVSVVKGGIDIKIVYGTNWFYLYLDKHKIYNTGSLQCNIIIIRSLAGFIFFLSGIFLIYSKL